MVNLLVAAAIAIASPAAPSAATNNAPADASPAMFVVRDADTTVYLFGTFHALDGQSEWFNDGVRSAFESSNELILETIVPEGPLPPLEMRRPLTSQVAPSASFLATTKMAIKAGKAQGMQVNNGADMVLRHAAELEGKPVAGLETMESQLNMFAKMAASADANRPVSTPSGAATTPAAAIAKSMADMQSAWKRGDQSVFVNILSQLNQASPATYKMLFTDRNGRWADWVAARLQTPGTVFVAVGAGHLAGRDSVLVQLAQRGLECRRVN